MFDESTAATVLAAHRVRLGSIDPLLPEPGPMPDPGDADMPLVASGAVGVSRRVLLDPGDVGATWGALDQRWLSAQVTGPESMAGLLGRWREHLTSSRPGSDSSAMVVWPSRDVAMTRVFLDSGLLPQSVIAVRLAGRPTPPTGALVDVRRAGPADLDDVVALRVEEIRFGAEISGQHPRPNAAELMRDQYAAALSSAESLVWLAYHDGRAVGMVSVIVGEKAAWVGSLVAAAPVAYVDCAAVAPSHRGGGVAAALIRHIHNAMDEAGIAATLLHYDPLNPLSVPFWHRSGYRPLRTRWQLVSVLYRP